MRTILQIAFLESSNDGTGTHLLNMTWVKKRVSWLSEERGLPSVLLIQKYFSPKIKILHIVWERI